MSFCPHLSEPVILDACVLIDFIKADRSMLYRITRHVCGILVLSTTLREVEDTNREEATELGLEIADPEWEDVRNAADLVSSLSFEDWICLLTAKRRGLTCVSNDRRLRQECGREKVRCVWGLEMVLALTRMGQLSRRQAIEFAEQCRSISPAHYTERILKVFTDQICTDEG